MNCEEKVTNPEVSALIKMIASYKKAAGRYPDTLAINVDGETVVYRLEVKQPKPFLAAMETIRAWNSADCGYQYKPKHEKVSLWQKIQRLKKPETAATVNRPDTK